METGAGGFSKPSSVFSPTAADFKPAGALAVWPASVSAASAAGRFLTLFAALGLVLAVIYFFLPAGRPGDCTRAAGV